MPQSRLGAYTEPDDEPDERATTGSAGRSPSGSGDENHQTAAATQPSPTTIHHLACPWCLAPPSEFDKTGATTSCETCAAVIPTDAEWYRRGQKIASTSGMA